jgi:antitoxin CptB
MDDPHRDPNHARRRRLLYRAEHRGTREHDRLIGGFVRVRIDSFDTAEIAALEDMLAEPEPLIDDWLRGRVAPPAAFADLIARILAAATPDASPAAPTSGARL